MTVGPRRLTVAVYAALAVVGTILVIYRQSTANTGLANGLVVVFLASLVLWAFAPSSRQ